MNTSDLIAKCKEELNSDQEPNADEWREMVESLCDALEQCSEKTYKKYLGEETVKLGQVKNNGFDVGYFDPSVSLSYQWPYPVSPYNKKIITP